MKQQWARFRRLMLRWFGGRERGGRSARAHVRAAVLVATVIALGLALSLYWAQRAAADEEEAAEVFAEVHTLRVDVQDYEAARALAEDFLALRSEELMWRQKTHYEGEGGGA